MKYGLITFKETENIGDDIQSYSVIQYLPRIDYYIDREKLDLFVPTKKENVITIMNGWFLHSKTNFLLSPYIHPIFMSTHISEYESEGIKTEYINDYTKENFIKYGPIGCRDSSTSRLLTKKGIDNYISGCFTLTIPKDSNIKKQDYICIVDVDKKIEEQIYNHYDSSKIIKKTHTLNSNINKKLSWTERFKNVKKLLDVYQSSRIVITSRLHCALPCLALGTPVILIYDEGKKYTKDRLSDYAKIVTSLSTEEFLEKGIELIDNNINNPNNYEEIQKQLKNRIKEKLNNISITDKKNLPLVESYSELYVKRKKMIDELHKITAKKLEDLSKENFENLSAVDYWKKEYNKIIKLYNPQNSIETNVMLNKITEKYEDLCVENKYLREKLSLYNKKNNKKND